MILHFEDGTQIGQDLVAEEAIMPLDFIDILLKTWKNCCSDNLRLDP